LPKPTERRSVVIFVKEGQSFTKIDTLHQCTEQTLEACAVELETKLSNLIALYRAPYPNFNQFIKLLDAALKYLYDSKFVVMYMITIKTIHY
jgi:hypothetical protein